MNMLVGSSEHLIPDVELFPDKENYERGKRLFDVFVSGLLLALLLPLLLVVACVIKIDSPGTVLYGQNRCGKRGRHFYMWKFRSMSMGADAEKSDLSDASNDDLRFKVKSDPRITRVGKFIRKYSIDELPQLFNVLIGDMSLVGPRPPLPDEVAKYTKLERRRLEVVPGITCFWQVQGRSEIPFSEQVKLDLDYIRRRSLLLDFSILLKTPFAVLAARGAY